MYVLDLIHCRLDSREWYISKRQGHQPFITSHLLPLKFHIHVYYCKEIHVSTSCRMHSSYLQSIINIIVLCILSNIERNGKINSNVKHNFIQIASTCRSTATLGYNCLTASYMRP